MAVFLELPYTEEGKRLALTREEEENCRVVYRRDGRGGAVFCGLWETGAEYPEDRIIVPLRSVFDCVGTVKAKTAFANVTGSKKDPNRTGYKNWLELYVRETKCGWVSSCCTDGCFYDSASRTETKLTGLQYNAGLRETITIRAACGGSMNAGHVIVGAKAAASVMEGGTVCLLPICTYHNVAFVRGYSWGAGFYMKLGSDTKAVRLKEYLQLS